MTNTKETPTSLYFRRLALGVSRETVAIMARMNREILRRTESDRFPTIDPSHVQAIDDLEAWERDILPVLAGKIMEQARRHAVNGRPIVFAMRADAYEAFGMWKGETRNLANLYDLAAAEAFMDLRDSGQRPIAAELLAGPYRAWLQEHGKPENFANRVQWWSEFSSQKEWGR